MQIPTIRGEPENQRVRRERLVLEEFRAEIDLLEMRAKYNEDKYQSIDNKVNSFLKNKTSVSTSNILTRMWKDECLYEEQKSIQRWEKSETWLLKYETQFKHEYEGKNPFMKAGDAQSKNKSNPESRNYQATPDFIQNYSSYPRTNRNQTRQSIPFHKPPFRQNRKQRRNYTTPRNSFLGHGPRQNQIT